MILIQIATGIRSRWIPIRTILSMSFLVILWFPRWTT